MKNTYRVILMGLAVLGIVYASTGPEGKTEEVESESIEKCLKSSTGPEEKIEEVENEAIEKCLKSSTGPEEKIEEVENEAIEKCLKSSTEPEEKTKKVWYKPVDICKFPLFMEVGHYVQLKECRKREIKLVQVDCKSIGRDGGDFPCYKGSDVIEVRANFPAIFNASIDKSDGYGDMLNKVNLYWENGVNTIQGGVGWEELKLCLEVWGVELYKFTTIGTVEVGEISIEVRPPDEAQLEE